MKSKVVVYASEALARYAFPGDHPFCSDRQQAFWDEARRQGLHERVSLGRSRSASRDELSRFHVEAHLRWVQACSFAGTGYLDEGDTPAFPGIFEAGSTVVGSALDGVQRIMSGEAQKTFQPIGGMHHARPDRAAGFCVFNDIGVVVNTLRQAYGVRRIAYVDIDVHHGDGVFYSFEADPELIVADIHEDGRFLYPGTGHAEETGKGPARGTKLNIALAPGSGDREFFAAWPSVEQHLRAHNPEFIILQAGADLLAGDPLADLRCSPAAHSLAARSLARMSADLTGGKMMAFGGGGYAPSNIAAAWTAVLREMLEQK